jgi:hypothetical protein
LLPRCHVPKMYQRTGEKMQPLADSAKNPLQIRANVCMSFTDWIDKET